MSASSELRLSPLAGGQAASCETANPPIGIAASVAASGAPRFPCDGALAAAGPGANCRSVAIAAQAAADDLAASGEMSDRFAALFAADLSALHDIGLTIGRNDGLAPAAGRAAVHHSVVVAVAQTDNYAVAADNFAAAADNFAVAAIHNSVTAGIDNCVAAQAGFGIGAGLQAGWTLVAGVVPDAWVAADWVPGEKDAAPNRCDDFAQSRALPPEPAS